MSTEKLTCQICGQACQVISAGHLKKHGLTVAEYKEKYGPVASPDFIQRSSEFRRNYYKHDGIKNEYEIRGDILVLFVDCKGQRHECLVDLDDKPKLDQIHVKWTGKIDKKNRNRIRVSCRVNEDRYHRTLVSMSRYLMGDPEDMQVDHINGDTLDNRKINLRIVTQSANKQNTQGPYKNNQSGVRGVCWNNVSKYWVATVRLDREIVWKETFQSLAVAEKAVKAARAKYQPFSPEARENK